MYLEQVKRFVESNGSQKSKVLWKLTPYDEVKVGDTLTSGGWARWQVLAKDGDIMLVENKESGQEYKCKKLKAYWMVLKEENTNDVE